MTTQAQDVFKRLALLPASEHAAALTRECAGNAALRAQVESLLSAGRPRSEMRSADDMPTTGAVGPSPAGRAAAVGAPPSPEPGAPGASPVPAASPSAPTAHPAGEIVGTQVGPYRLLELLGEGGFGSVFMAEQTRPVQRKVALKIIKLGMDTRQVVARFEQERQALAMMDHPHIARVLDAGATDSGRPYFVMELVRGRPIAAYCDDNALSIEDRLRLFVQVCGAVQHAHTKGVIHRDLKPSNILVTSLDDGPCAKVIDFGIAKATSSRLTDKTLYTQHQQMIGTPEYMSPEQAEGSLDVDTRTDVYSLGVILYELLTGATPFSGSDLRSADLHDVKRIIRTFDPPKPSTRLSRATPTISGIATARRTEPARLSSAVRGELDWIVMKAMDKDRQRRYETANGLAMDVQRYLAGQAVLAAPPSAAYHLRKFIARHRAAVAAAAVVAFALVLGLVGTLWGARVAALERDAAQRDRDRAVAAEKLAEENFQTSRRAVKRYLERVSDSPELKARGLESLRAQLLGTAREFYEQFVRQRASDPALRAELGDAHVNLSNIYRLIARTDEAEAAGKNARDIFASLVRDHPGEASYRRQLATAWANLGLLYSDTRRLPQAEEAFRAAQDAENELAGLTELDVSDKSRAANTDDNLALFYKSTGRLAESEAAHKQAMAIREELVRAEPSNEDFQNNLMHSCINLTDLYANSGRAAEAEPLLKRAADICEDLLRRSPDSPDYLNGMGATLNNLGGVYVLLGKFDDARAAYRRAVPIRERLAAEHPVMIEYGLHLGSAYCNLGELEAREGNPREALPWLDKAIGALDGVLNREPRHSTARFYQSYTRGWRARALAGMSDWTGAAEEWERAIALDDRHDPDLRAGHAEALARAGQLGPAERELDGLSANDSLSPEAAVALAAAESLCSTSGELGASVTPAERARRATEHQARAVSYLKHAASLGFFKDPKAASKVKSDSAFDPLRTRADFQELLAGLP